VERRTLPAFDSRKPDSTDPAIEVFLALDGGSAKP